MHELIADMPMDERPRERMLTHGAKSLSDAELLAVLLGSGMQGKNAIELARDLLREGFSSLAQCDAEQLARREGMGIAKATRIIATFEIARRVANDKPGDPPHFDVNSFSRGFIARSRYMTQEHLGALFLDSRRRVLREREIYVGTSSKALVSTREVMRYALDANAAGVVLYHNHPSGDPSPSDEDLKYTRKMQRSLRLIDIHLVDHIIAGAHGFTSLSTRGFK
ncbi:MAG: DNA repair protein RadC [Acidobacteria bacterium]|nr:DNA repair protein RadC [Acidobacteriota bacterium]MBV9067544.1 DNA repair protein RadC [Acidobacteriota bacterium]MBV9184456.1 DNA repair protein RadC [Acidobacteriota bacterium]